MEDYMLCRGCGESFHFDELYLNEADTWHYCYYCSADVMVECQGCKEVVRGGDMHASSPNVFNDDARCSDCYKTGVA